MNNYESNTHTEPLYSYNVEVKPHLLEKNEMSKMHQNGESSMKTKTKYQKYCQTFNKND